MNFTKRRFTEKAVERPRYTESSADNYRVQKGWNLEKVCYVLQFLIFATFQIFKRKRRLKVSVSDDFLLSKRHLSKKSKG